MLPAFFSQLASLGWDPYFEEKFNELARPGERPARVIADFGAEYLVHDDAESGRAVVRLADPVVGDWVSLRDWTIQGIVDRRTVFSRRAAGEETAEQVLASNVEVAFVVAAATDINVSRIERYLTIAWQSGAAPVVLITKADLIKSVEPPSLPATTIVTSSVTGEGLGDISRHLLPAKTGVLLGPSGAGKSSLINRICGTEVMRTREIHQASGEGRHMTSHRQLIRLPGGGMIIDTPGLREAQLWEGEQALGSVFEDIEALTLRCRFSDCAHDTEPGCAVKEAIAEGTLEARRFESFRKLQRELRAVAAKHDARMRAEDRKKWRQIATTARTRIRP